MRILSVLAAIVLTSTMVLADDHQAKARAELNAFNDRFNALSAARNTEGLAALYAVDSLWIAPKTPPAPGQKLARETFGFLAAKKGSLVHTVDELILSDDSTQAVMIGDAIVKVERAGLDFTGTYLFVLQRQQDGWQIVTDMFNQHVED